MSHLNSFGGFFRAGDPAQNAPPPLGGTAYSTDGPHQKKYGGLKIKKIMPQHVDMTVKFVKNTSRACNTVLTEIST
jgi:hypothetical protein